MESTFAIFAFMDTEIAAILGDISNKSTKDVIRLANNG